MDIDHIFIFTDDNGKAGDELISFGLTQGASHVHQGQGTTNHVFRFENFYLEILWVHNQVEIVSETTKPTGLWQRAEYYKNTFSPFGMCIANTENTDELFKNAFSYQPSYFPQGMAIEIIKNENQPDLPWTFRLPFKGDRKIESEPVKHANGVQKLTKATFYYQNIIHDDFLDYFKNEKQIEFIKSDKAWLTLTFDNGKQVMSREFEKIRLTIRY